MKKIKKRTFGTLYYFGLQLDSSKTCNQESLATTFEDIVGERQEDEDEEDRRTLRGSFDDNDNNV